MSANPPITAIPAQQADPDGHIRRYLDSLEPHRRRGAYLTSPGATISLRATVPVVLGAPGTERRSNQDVGREGGQVLTEAELGTLRRWAPLPDSPGPSRQPHLHRMDRAPEAAVPYGTNRRSTPILRPKAPNLPEYHRTEGPDIDRRVAEGPVSETESGIRRRERKIRRREKAAILKPKIIPPTPPPLPVPQRQAKRGRKGSHVLEKDSEGSDSLEPERYDRSRLGTKVRRGLGLDVMATFKPENIVSSRITLRPGRTGGFLGKGKSSLPLKSWPDQRRKPQAFDEKAFLNPKPLPAEQSTHTQIEWSHRGHPRYQDTRNAMHLARFERKRTSSSHFPSSQPSSIPPGPLPTLNAPNHARRYAPGELPPAGVATSPSWPSVPLEGEQSSSVHTRSLRSRPPTYPGPLPSWDIPEHVRTEYDPPSWPAYPRSVIAWQSAQQPTVEHKLPDTFDDDWQIDFWKRRRPESIHPQPSQREAPSDAVPTNNNALRIQYAPATRDGHFSPPDVNTYDRSPSSPEPHPHVRRNSSKHLYPVTHRPSRLVREQSIEVEIPPPSTPVIQLSDDYLITSANLDWTVEINDDAPLVIDTGLLLRPQDDSGDNLHETPYSTATQALYTTHAFVEEEDFGRRAAYPIASTNYETSPPAGVYMPDAAEQSMLEEDMYGINSEDFRRMWRTGG